MEMTITRSFEAPAEQVWRAWTDSDQVKRWWGPIGFTCPVAEMEVRPGGTSLVCMRTPDGHDMYNTWTYSAVEPFTRLEFVHRFSDADGNHIDPARLGLPPGIPAEVRHVLTFEPVAEGKSTFTVTEFGYSAAEVVEMSRAGMAECLDKLAASLD